MKTNIRSWGGWLLLALVVVYVGFLIAAPITALIQGGLSERTGRSLAKPHCQALPAIPVALCAHRCGRCAGAGHLRLADRLGAHPAVFFQQVPDQRSTGYPLCAFTCGGRLYAAPALRPERILWAPCWNRSTSRSPSPSPACFWQLSSSACLL